MDYSKLSPELAIIVDEHSEGGDEALTAYAAEDEPSQLVGVSRPDRPTRVIFTLECVPDADLSGLAQHGIEINETEGRVRTGIAEITELPRLAAHPGVIRISSAQPHNAFMDVAPGKVGLPAFKKRTGLTGKGVIVGVIDSGIDPKHPAFAGRILKIWDQTAKHEEGFAYDSVRRKPTGYDYGVEYVKPHFGDVGDSTGHGTHVAGIAAAADQKYPGVAPGADLVVVKVNPAQLDTHLKNGIDYVFALAKTLKRPAVVNISLGTHADPHDGTGALCQAIDEAAGPGKIICCAAGNQALDDIHAQARVGKNTPESIKFTQSPSGLGTWSWLNGWYSGADEIEIEIICPDGGSTGYQPILPNGPTGKPHKNYLLSDRWKVRIATPGPDPANKDHQFRVQFLGLEAGKPWTMRLRAKKAGDTSVQVDVWCSEDLEFDADHAQETMTVAAPGCATSAITVGAYTTKNRWRDIKNKNQTIKGLDLDEVVATSSKGPRRDDVRKPDLVAPGVVIVSSRSAGSSAKSGYLVDDRHVVQYGTSMASPFVAGVIALLLSQDPTLDAEKARKKLKYTKNKTYNVDSWGAGLIALPE
ncbi:S8 family serine peptidase [Actinoallomurus purpureus]|uniref:S8 family serine peptidase n=1 Tax=Actinoallomurus purpureus TaxID=478114 RepID=UPI0020932F78|nr:S8 family serine peptidase [Actinoallomurus purpureus]MCO6004962.1 S8 family serine peptidase [Actinoallomurus purpureus]